MIQKSKLRLATKQGQEVRVGNTVYTNIKYTGTGVRALMVTASGATGGKTGDDVQEHKTGNKSVCVLRQMRVCPRANVCVSSCKCVCVLILICVCPHADR